MARRGMKNVYNSGNDPYELASERDLKTFCDTSLRDTEYLIGLLTAAFLEENDLMYDQDSPRFENISPAKYRKFANEVTHEIDETIQRVFAKADAKINDEFTLGKSEIK